MNNFVKKAIDLIKSSIKPAKSNNSETTLASAFETMENELEETEKQYGKKFFPSE